LSTRELLHRMMTTISSPGDRELFIEALATFHLDDYLEGERASVLIDALEEWRSMPAIARWREQRLTQVIIKHFLGLSQLINYRPNSLPRLLEVAQLSAADRRRVLIEGAESTGLALGSRALFGVAELLAGSLEPTLALTILNWYLARLNRRIPESHEEVLDPNDLPANLNEAVARFVYSLMSDVDTRIRWRASHAARRLARLGAVDTFHAIFANYDRTTDISFRGPDAPYYWLAARLWALMTASRVAVETPASLAPLLDNAHQDRP
jgi:hypothetical protein